MINIFNYDNYQDYLIDAIEEKKTSSTGKASLRGLAKRINISVAYLSKVLNKKQHLSVQSALLIADWLNLKISEKEYLINLIKLATESRLGEIAKIQNKLEALNSAHRRKNADSPIFETLCDWKHISTIVLMGGKYNKLSAADLAKILNISNEEAKATLTDLEEAKIVVANKQKIYQRTDNSSRVMQSYAPNLPMRQFYKQHLDIAKHAIDHKAIEERHIGTETILIDQRQVEEAKRIMEDCFTRMVALATASKGQDQLYNLGIQLVKISQV